MEYHQKIQQFRKIFFWKRYKFFITRGKFLILKYTSPCIFLMVPRTINIFFPVSFLTHGNNFKKTSKVSSSNQPDLVLLKNYLDHVLSINRINACFWKLCMVEEFLLHLFHKTLQRNKSYCYSLFSQGTSLHVSKQLFYFQGHHPNLFHHNSKYYEMKSPSSSILTFSKWILNCSLFIAARFF